MSAAADRRDAGPLVPHSAVVVATGLAVLGAVVMGLAWYEISGTPRVDRQVRWASAGVAGACLSVVVLMSLVLAARRAVASRVDDFAAAVAPRFPRPPTSSLSVDEDDGVRVATKSMLRYHRASCSLTAQKPVLPLSAVAHEDAGRKPCGVCEA